MHRITCEFAHVEFLTCGISQVIHVSNVKFHMLESIFEIAGAKKHVTREIYMWNFTISHVNFHLWITYHMGISDTKLHVWKTCHMGNTWVLGFTCVFWTSHVVHMWNTWQFSVMDLYRIFITFTVLRYFNENRSHHITLNFLYIILHQKVIKFSSQHFSRWTRVFGHDVFPSPMICAQVCAIVECRSELPDM